MKLIHAEFTNFRLLRDVMLDFSTDDEKRLTVIRAENESGKTTILTGIQWGLYGNNALPGGSRQEYRLHPIDWNLADGARVPVTVEIDFEIKSTRPSKSGGLIETKTLYRIIRSTYDTLRGESWEPGPTSVQLFELTATGSDPIDPPDAVINEEIPPELREIFFTDGDRTLSFIEADVSQSTKQTRVRKAIQSLLGLDLIEDAMGRVRRSGSDINKEIKGNTSQDELDSTAGRYTQLLEDAEKLRAQIEDADQQFANFDERHALINKKIEDTLIQGNREELQQELSRATRQIEQVNTQQDEAATRHFALFREMTLARDLTAPLLDKAFAILNELRDEGKIPNSTIPVLEERLQTPFCICGESLQEKDNDSVRRREHIAHLIEESRQADALQGAITDLYFGSMTLQPNQETPPSSWWAQALQVINQRDKLQRVRGELGQALRAIEAKIGQIPDNDIQGLRETRKQYADQRDRSNSARSRYRADLRNIEGDIELTKRRRDQLLRMQGHGQRIMANLEVAQDVETVLRRTYERLTTDELEKVSERMNDIFLTMIGADPEIGATIQEAQIAPSFEITVYGPNARPLNPDRDLNGASRRALTLAFILALTRVSEVEAPNVIDTPLGTMSGYVKRSVLNTAVEESSQLILFLTRSEIMECEDILDSKAGAVITLTNPRHYPIMLENEPEVDERTILTCTCNHRQDCDQCRRRPSERIAEALSGFQS